MSEWAAYFHFAQWPPRPSLLFWFALTLVAGALLGGAAFRQLGLPRIVGYSAVGMVLAGLGLGLTDGQLHGTDRLIVDLALALLLFELGSRVCLGWLKVNPALLLTSALESLLTFLALFAVLRWFDFGSDVALVRISANVTGDFGNVTGLRSGAGLRGEDCRKGLFLTGLATS